MDKAILVLNIGFSSIKFGIIDPDKGEKTLDIAYCGKIEESGHQTQFVIEHMRGRGSGVLPVDDGNSLHTTRHGMILLHGQRARWVMQNWRPICASLLIVN